jgi:dimethylhistidine N-methyltransferase
MARSSEEARLFQAETQKNSTVENSQINPNTILNEIKDGMAKKQKELPSKLFYDEVGSQLFDQITELEEYYPTRTEALIMRDNIKAMAAVIGAQCMLIEFGSGSSLKTRILLDHLPSLAAYVPVDISKEHLYKTTEDLRVVYPGLEVSPVWADYTSVFDLPDIDRDVAHRTAYFPGSTIGNFHPDQAILFMRNVARMVGSGGGLLIGADLQKDPHMLDLAYNDSKGITAAFNLNMLIHINREFGADFDVEQFEHCAFYDQGLGRIEMHLVSQIDQTVHVDGVVFQIKANESIRTEVSYKYTFDGFADLAQKAGFDVKQVWTDPDNLFSVQFLVAK